MRSTNSDTADILITFAVGYSHGTSNATRTTILTQVDEDGSAFTGSTVIPVINGTSGTADWGASNTNMVVRLAEWRGPLQNYFVAEDLEALFDTDLFLGMQFMPTATSDRSPSDIRIVTTPFRVDAP